MAVSSGWTHGGLLQTAGVAPSAYGMEIHLAAEQMQIVVPLVDSKTIEPGEDLYIPKLGQETVTTLYAKTTTDGTTFTKSTDLQGNQISFSAIDDSAVQLMEKFQYVGMAHAKPAWDRMPSGRKMNYINGRKTLASKALARAKDASILTLANPGLITTANEMYADAPEHWTYETVKDLLTLYKTSLASGPLYVMAPISELPYLIDIEQFHRFNWTGVSGGVAKDLVFTFGPLTVFTHADVYDDTVDGLHSLAWVPEAIGFRDVRGLEVDDWYDGDTKSYKTSPDTDYAYGIVDATQVFTIQNPR